MSGGSTLLFDEVIDALQSYVKMNENSGGSQVQGLSAKVRSHSKGKQTKGCFVCGQNLTTGRETVKHGKRTFVYSRNLTGQICNFLKISQDMDQKKPEVGVVVLQSKTQTNVSSEGENKMRADLLGGCSTNFTQSYKAEEFGGKHIGASLFSPKEDDEFVDLYGAQHQTQVQLKESIQPYREELGEVQNHASGIHCLRKPQRISNYVTSKPNSEEGLAMIPSSRKYMSNNISPLKALIAREERALFPSLAISI
ncbi:hypothetical protein ACLB2K_015545 [Fragaria x ananassa]